MYSTQDFKFKSRGQRGKGKNTIQKQLEESIVNRKLSKMKLLVQIHAKAHLIASNCDTLQQLVLTTQKHHDQ